jgi:hypothetical protein
VAVFFQEDRYFYCIVQRRKKYGSPSGAHFFRMVREGSVIIYITGQEIRPDCLLGRSSPRWGPVQNVQGPLYKINKFKMVTIEHYTKCRVLLACLIIPMKPALVVSLELEISDMPKGRILLEPQTRS